MKEDQPLLAVPQVGTTLQTPSTSWIPLDESSAAYYDSEEDGAPPQEQQQQQEEEENSVILKALDKCWPQPRQSTTIRMQQVSVRDHLANERTYLAWIRTSLALIGASIAILKFDNGTSRKDDKDADLHSIQLEGYLLGVIGVAALVTSTYRYFRVMKLLRQNQYEPNVTPIIVLVVVVSTSVALAFCLHFLNSLQ